MAGRNLFGLIVRLALFLTVPLCTLPVRLAQAASLIKTQDFNFGMIAGGAGYSGTVTVDASGARHASGDVLLLSGASSPARFTLYGDPGDLYALTLPAEFAIDSGADRMRVSAVTASIPIAGTLPAGGTLSFSVGGTLTVTSSQRNGPYNGSLEITAK